MEFFFGYVHYFLRISLARQEITKFFQTVKDRLRVLSLGIGVLSIVPHAPGESSSNSSQAPRKLRLL